MLKSHSIESRLSVEALVRRPGRCEASIRRRELRLSSDSDDEDAEVVTTAAAVSNAMQCAAWSPGKGMVWNRREPRPKGRGVGDRRRLWNGQTGHGEWEASGSTTVTLQPSSRHGDGDSTVQQPTIIGQPNVTLTGFTRHARRRGLQQSRQRQRRGSVGRHLERRGMRYLLGGGNTTVA